MSDDRIPAVHRNTHLLFRPERAAEPAARCVLCHGDASDFDCERCAAPFHADCHLERAMSAPERALFLAAVAEREVTDKAKIDETVLARLARLAEALGRPLAEVMETLQGPPGPAEMAVAALTYLCQGCRS